MVEIGRVVGPSRLFGAAGAALLTLALAGCGSSGDSGAGSDTSVSEVSQTTSTTEAATTSAAPPETSPPTTDPPQADPAGTSSLVAICLVFDSLQDHLEELDQPGVDHEALLASITEAAAEMTNLSPPGHEAELTKLELAWDEFGEVLRQHNYDMDDAEADLDLIAGRVGLDDNPAVVQYLYAECPS